MGHSHSEPHISPLSVYFTVFSALIVLTFVTVGVVLGFATRIVHHCCYGCGIGQRYVGCNMVYALDS